MLHCTPPSFSGSPHTGKRPMQSTKRTEELACRLVAYSIGTKEKAQAASYVLCAMDIRWCAKLTQPLLTEWGILTPSEPPQLNLPELSASSLDVRLASMLPNLIRSYEESALITNGLAEAYSTQRMS